MVRFWAVNGSFGWSGGKGSPAHVTEDMGESGQRSGTYRQKVSGLTLRLKKAKLT